ncbi:MAG: hypothetical protein WDO19_03100 [Bacteroidota bacterium]
MNPIRQLLVALAILFMLSACKKEPASTSPFTETTYTTLAPYDNTGKPSGLLHDVISDSLTAFIAATLPEGQDLTLSHPEFFSSSAIADIAITQVSDVYVTFVQQGGKLNNALAFYTYPSSQSPASAKEIKNIIYFFPRCKRAFLFNPGR